MMKYLTLARSGLLGVIMATTEGTTEVVTAETIMSILTAITDVMSVTQIVAMIAGIFAVAMTFVFLWWGIRKGYKSILVAVTRGKLKI